jgi:hypothetical protein
MSSERGGHRHVLEDDRGTDDPLPSVRCVRSGRAGGAMSPTLLPSDHPDAPKYWALEASGVLEPVVRAYLAGDDLSLVQIQLMRAYLWQWVKSPVWGPSGALEALRLRVVAIQTHVEVEDAIETMIALGMDPL